MMLASVLAWMLAAACIGELPDSSPLHEDWEYIPAMRRVADDFQGRSGVVLHVGDSLTYANPYSQWAVAGKGKTPEDRAVLEWMHLGTDDERDGWWLCRFDHPAGGRSFTACGGLTLNELLAGGRQDLESLSELLAKYRAQIVVLMIGTNDATHRRPVDQFRKDYDRAVEQILAQHTIPIVSTIPPHPQQQKLAAQYNNAIRAVARQRKLPLIDLEQEILLRRPDDWNGTLLEKDNPHLSAARGEVNATSEPTEANLRESGYLLRGWLSVRKIAEVKRRVIDRPENSPQQETPRTSLPKQRGQPRYAAPHVRLPIIRDTWFSNVDAEADGNQGGAEQLKLKSIQEMSLVDFDPELLKGRVVKAATLYVCLAGPERLQRVTVSSFAAPWVEGAATGYALEAGSSTFNHARHPTAPWSFAGSDLSDVMLGRSGTLWHSADASEPDVARWQKIPVDPRVIAARVAGLSYGCLLFDDTGSEWSREGEKFALRVFPNRFIYSRQSNLQRVPFFAVELGEADREPPAAPAKVMADAAELPAGQAWLRWEAPEDRGPAGVLGFDVEINGESVPRYLISAAPSAGKSVQMHVRDLNLAPGAKVKAAVRAVDAAGNRGPASELEFEVSNLRPAALPASPQFPSPPIKPLPRLAGAEVAVIDALDKVQPISGEIIPPHPVDYLAANHLWDAGSRTIRLHAAKNEFVDFQLLLRGEAPPIAAEVMFPPEDSIEASLAGLPAISTARGPLPDPVVENGGGARGNRLSGQVSESRFVELYVPHSASAGKHVGSVRLRSKSGQTLELRIELEVWDFTLPDSLSFLPEMNCYALPDGERDYYRLAHRHRTVLNRVPYYQNGVVADGCAPALSGGSLDWSAWDRRFGPYLDGSAFSDLPRKSAPLECFYLPLHENWPSPMASNYRGGYWADQAFPVAYRKSFVDTSRQMAEHFAARGWRDTFFQCFLNGKNNFKAGGWSKGSSPWLLDEPANFQDFWALRYFGEAFHQGVAEAAGGAKMMFRCDISRPQWQRDVLDDVLDYNVVGGAFRRYRRMVLDRKEADHQMVIEYGGSNPVEQSNVQPAAWCVDAWTLGADGVLPWQTIGKAESWQKADTLSLFYPGTAASGFRVTPSLRLKAYRRGQQDVEYLTIWMLATGQPRWAVGEAVRKALKMRGASTAEAAAGGDEAGMVQFENLLPEDLWRLRRAVGADLSRRRPVPSRRLVDYQPRRRDTAAPGSSAQ